MRWSLAIAALAVSSACGGGPAPSPARPAVSTSVTPDAATHVSEIPRMINEPEELAAKLVEQLAARDFAHVTASFDATMKKALSNEQLESVWTGIVASCGAFERITATQVKKIPLGTVVVLTGHFAKADNDITITYDATRAVSGLYINRKHAHAPPTYIDPTAFTEIDVTVGSGASSLPGTVTLPKVAGKVPGVVLVHGSGPQDRDETVGGAKPFRDLAWGLASRGIAVLRYEKRTRVYGARMTPQQLAELTVKEETIDDAVLAVATLTNATPEGATTTVDRARRFVLGHSLGGTVAPRIAVAVPELAGIVIMAGSTRPLEDVILEQYTYLAGLDGTISDEEKARLDLMKKKVARVKDPGLDASTPAGELPLGVAAKYWLDLRAYDPAFFAKNVKRPMLILQGGRDYQVTTEDFGRYKTAVGSRPNVTFKLYPGLNHLFTAAPEGVTTPKSVPAEYESAAHVDVGVVEDIAKWVTQTKRPEVGK